MKKDMPLEGLRWSRDSGSALYDTPQTAVLGRAGGSVLNISATAIVASQSQDSCCRQLKTSTLICQNPI